MLGFVIPVMLCQSYMMVARLLYGLQMYGNILLNMPLFLFLRGKKEKTAKAATTKTTH